MDALTQIIEKTTKLNHQVKILSNIKSGKEATVYRTLLDGNLVAMKLYKNPEERDFKNTGIYLLGKHYKTPSHKKAVEKGNRFAKRLKQENWVKREFSMLKRLFEKGASIPKPILHIDNAIFMELLGDEKTVAPRLSDIVLGKKEMERAFETIIKNIKIFWDFGVAHGDLSEYNILWWKSNPYIIDFPQSVDKRTQENAREMLERDLKNVAGFFKKYIDVDFNKIQSEFT